MNEPPELVPDDFSALDAPLTIEVRIGDNALKLELAVESVSTLPPHRLRALPFSVVLRGPAAPALPQGTYPLSHPRLGIVQVFLVPIAADGQSRRYEATFN